MKAHKAGNAKKFEDIPNVGPRVARDFRTLGFTAPKDLKGKDPFVLYKKLCAKTKVRHDPCLLDVFMSVADFMNGGMARDWWYYTPKRKKMYPNI
ncbi:MAG: hypothetical protein RLZZ283_773 [Candidatus Parcubacteria bacterium]|jgi:hypothetical protein